MHYLLCFANIFIGNIPKTGFKIQDEQPVELKILVPARCKIRPTSAARLGPSSHLLSSPVGVDMESFKDLMSFYSFNLAHKPI